MAALQQHFSESYQSARAAFKRAAEQCGAHGSGEAIRPRGSGGDELTIDTAYLGPQHPEQMLVVSSGVHGAEGFAGSAIQHQFLTEQRTAFPLPANAGLLFVHAVNPFGFAELRRVNENNVDLNRNFVRHPDDHEPNPEYEALYEAINPEHIDTESEDASRKTLLAFAERSGFARLQEVLTCGQYEWPRGVEFGGDREEDSNRLIRQLARQETRGARRVAWVDLHTGLGGYGAYEMITDRSPDDPAYRRGRAWYGDAARSMVAGESVSAAVHGPMEAGIAEALPEDCELTFFAAEFGTFEPIRVFWAMRQDNWLHHHGDPDSEQGRAIKAEMVEVFRPDDPSWRKRVLEGGAQVLEQTRIGLLDSP